ncbi:unnamed protein product [marine sediment metagenome]|uniref:DUF423 domain-containing protein n=1 Tax=marine sediment metagenome TaxID=412755 RepID=X1SL28_9ZZZZ
MILGAFNGAFAVLAGAYGAHLIDVGHPDSAILLTFQKAVRYQMYHAFAIVIVALLANSIQLKILNISGWLFFLGIILFSGSLYFIVFTGIQWIEFLTPIGGFAFTFGWLGLVYVGFKNK